MCDFVQPFAPFEPSNLRFASGPSSPASPLTPPGSIHSFSKIDRSSDVAPSWTAFTDSNYMPNSPPPTPMPWIWRCHLCHAHYPLGTTRRCLHDDHMFCAGTTVKKRSGKHKRKDPCHSEFDYYGWGTYSHWRRKINQDQTYTIPTPYSRNCWNNCDFPSQCRQLNRYINSNLDEEPTSTPIHSSSPATTFDQITLAARSDSNLAVKKSSGLKLERFIKATGKRTTQLATFLSPTHEERSWSSLSSIPEDHKENQDSSLLGLGIGISKPDFVSFKTRMDRVHSSAQSGENVSAGPVDERGSFLSSNKVQKEPTTTRDKVIRTDKIHEHPHGDGNSLTLPNPVFNMKRTHEPVRGNERGRKAHTEAFKKKNSFHDPLKGDQKPSTTTTKALKRSRESTLEQIETPSPHSPPMISSATLKAPISLPEHVSRSSSGMQTPHSPPISLTARLIEPFELELEQFAHALTDIETDPISPLSPLRDAWDWIGKENSASISPPPPPSPSSSSSPAESFDEILRKMGKRQGLTTY